MKQNKNISFLQEKFMIVRNSYLILLVLLIGLGSYQAYAGIAQPGQYIGGDAAFVPHAQWEFGGSFVADSSDGPFGWGTRAPRRTVNGHDMSPGGTHGLIGNAADSGWLGALANNGGNGGNPAGQTGDAWISYDLDDVYALGDLVVWNWNSQANPGGGHFAGGLKDVIIDYSADGGANWTSLGQFTFAQAPSTAAYPGLVEANFGGALANKVVITVLNSYNHWTGPASTVHGLGEVAFDVQFTPGQNFIWDVRTDWSNTDNPNILLDIRGGQWSYHDAQDDSTMILGAGETGCGGVSADWKSVNGSCPNLTDIEGPLTEEPNEFTGHGDWRVKWESPISGDVAVNASMFQLFTPDQRMKMILSQNGQAFNSALVAEDLGGLSELGRDNLVQLSNFRNVSIGDTIEMTVLGTDADEGGNGDTNYVGASFSISEVLPPATTFDLTLVVINDDNTGSTPDNTVPAPGITTYAAGETVNLSAPRYANCPEVLVFDRWEGDVTDTAAINPSTVMNNDKTITVHYVDDRQCRDECHQPLAQDFNQDCLVDVVDLGSWVGSWLNCTLPSCDGL